MTDYERSVLKNIKFSELTSVSITTKFTDFECYTVLQNFMIHRTLFLIVLSYFLIFIGSICFYDTLKQLFDVPNMHIIYVFIIGACIVNVINSFGYSPNPDTCDCLEIYQYHIVHTICMTIFASAAAIVYYF